MVAPHHGQVASLDLLAVAAGVGVALLMLFMYRSSPSGYRCHGAEHTRSCDDLHTTKQ